MRKMKMKSISGTVDTRDLLTVNEAAQIYQSGKAGIYRLYYLGQLKSYRARSPLLFHRKDVLSALASRLRGRKKQTIWTNGKVAVSTWRKAT